MKNIFEGAKFGDKFKTRDGRTAIYAQAIEGHHYLIPEKSSFTYGYNDDGTLDSKIDVGFDIVSKIDEPAFKVGDTIGYCYSCPDFEGELIYGKVTAIEFDEHYGEWIYTIKGGNYEHFEPEEHLLQLCAYKK